MRTKTNQLAGKHLKPLRGPITARKFADAENPLYQVLKMRTSLASGGDWISTVRGTRKKYKKQAGHSAIRFAERRVCVLRRSTNCQKA